MRRALPICNFAVFCVWLFLSITTIPGRAQCCGSKCEDDGSCEDKKKITITNLAKTTMTGGAFRSWHFTVKDKFGTEWAGGTFTTSGSISLSTFCAPIDIQLTVDIQPDPDPVTGITTYLPFTTPDADAHYGPNPAPSENTGVGSDAGGSTSVHTSVDSPPVDLLDTTAIPVPRPRVTEDLLKFDWCAECGDPGTKSFGEGAHKFKVGSGCSVDPGKSCAKLGSVSFRINLGRERAGKDPVELTIKLDSLEPRLVGVNTISAFSPSNVEYPGIVNAYDLEVWCWKSYQVGRESDPDTHLSCWGAERVKYRYFDNGGYRFLFDHMHVPPTLKRAAGRKAGPTACYSEIIGLLIQTTPPSSRFQCEFIPVAPHYGFPKQNSGGWQETLHDFVFQMDKQSNLVDGVLNWTGDLVDIPPGAVDANGPGGAPVSDKSLDDYVRAIRQTMQPSSPDFTNWYYSLNTIASTGRPGDMPRDTSRDDDPQWNTSAGYSVKRVFDGRTPVATTNANGPVSVAGPDVLVEIISPPAQLGPNVAYEIHGYWRDQVGFSNNGESYTKSGEPFARWVVSAPDGLNAAHPTRFRIDEFHGTTLVKWHEWKELHSTTANSTSTTWQLNTGEGTKQEVEVQEKVESATTIVKTTTRQILDLGGLSNLVAPLNIGVVAQDRILSHHSTVQTRNSSNNFLQSTVSTDGFAAEAQTTTQHYDLTGKVTHMTRSDGYFEKYESWEQGPVEWSRTIRPWLTMAYSVNLTENDGVATTTSIEPLAGGGTLTTTYETIKGVLMSTTTTTETAATVLHLAYRPPQPVQRVVTVRTNAFDGVPRTSVSETYTAKAVESLAGKPAYRKDEGGRVTIYHHYNYMKYLNPGDSVTYERHYQEGAGGALDPLAFQTENVTNYYDRNGRQIQTVRSIPDVAGGNHAFDHVTTTYKNNGKVTERARLEGGRTLATLTYDVGDRNLLTEVDETGAATHYSQYDANGNPGTVSSASGTTLFTYDALGRVKTEARGSFVTATTYDSRGRVKTVTQGPEGAERTTTYAYSPASDTVTRPGGLVTSNERAIDGQRTLDWNGIAATSYIRLDANLAWDIQSPPVDGTRNFKNGTILEKRYIASELVSASITDGSGRTVAEFTPSFDASGSLAGSWRTFRFDSAGRVIAELVNGIVVGETTYSNNGATEIVRCAPNPDQIRTSSTVYSFVQNSVLNSSGNYEPSSENGWWQITSTLTGSSRQRLTGSQLDTISESVQTEGSLIARSKSTGTGLGDVTTVSTVSGVSNPSTTMYNAGRLMAAFTPDGRQTYFTYDSLGRQTDSNQNGRLKTHIEYDSIYGQPYKITVFEDNFDQPSQCSTETVNIYYDPASANPGLLKSSTTDGRTTYQSYTPAGQTRRIWGATYPQEYEYDSAGRLWKLHTFRTPELGDPFFAPTWPASAGTGDVTTWEYKYGLLWKKTDAASHAVVYTYDEQARLKTRTTARGIVTTYGYDRAGQMTSTTYSDGTPNVTYARDSEGRLVTAQTAGGSNWSTGRRYSYGYEGMSANVATETLDPSDFNPNYMGYGSISRSYTNGRLTTTNGHFFGNTVTDYQDYLVINQSRSYNPANGRFSDIVASRSGFSGTDFSSVGSMFQYDHQSVVYPTTVTTATPGGVSIVTTKTPDGIGRLTNIDTTAGSVPTYAMTYEYTNGLRMKAITTRRSMTNQLQGADWEYSYNGRGELKGGVKKLNGVLVPGYDFGYGFDSIGNRLSTTVNGNVSTLVPNSLNQTVSRTVPGTLDIRGSFTDSDPQNIPTSATPQSAAALLASQSQGWIFTNSFVDGNFSIPFPFPNTVGPRAEAINIKMTANHNGNNVEDTITRRAILPATPEVITHDLDGNMTSDGLWNYIWDAENRLIRITAKPGAAPWFDSPTLMEYKYDWMGRRIESAVYGPLSNVVHRTKFLWDRWNILAQSDWGATPTGQGTVLRAYVWGNDLSGSEQGAGGVGGLLAVQAHEPGVYLGMSGTVKTYCPTYDGNGNVMSYINAATGTVEQEEEYGPFGENLRPRSMNILRCPIGWSTKYTDEETGLVAYQLRFYNPTLGRWMSRDPIEEDGGVNLYGMCRGNAISRIDYLGLDWKKAPQKDQPTDEFRVVWKRDSDKDTLENLAKQLDLDPVESLKWSKKKDDCTFSVPNVWIDADLLRGGGLKDRIINLGGTFGRAFTFTGKKRIKVDHAKDLEGSIRKHKGDIIGFSLYAHGSQEGDIVMPDKKIVDPIDGIEEYDETRGTSQGRVLYAIDENGFKLAKAYVMQCYSGYNGKYIGRKYNWDEQWRKHVFGKLKVYHGLNVLGLDLGSR